MRICSPARQSVRAGKLVINDCFPPDPFHLKRTATDERSTLESNTGEWSRSLTWSNYHTVYSIIILLENIKWVKSNIIFFKTKQNISRVFAAENKCKFWKIKFGNKKKKNLFSNNAEVLKRYVLYELSSSKNSLKISISNSRVLFFYKWKPQKTKRSISENTTQIKDKKKLLHI